MGEEKPTAKLFLGTFLFQNSADNAKNWSQLEVVARSKWSEHFWSVARQKHHSS